jgi:hypothetical protein
MFKNNYNDNEIMRESQTGLNFLPRDRPPIPAAAHTAKRKETTIEANEELKMR